MSYYVFENVVVNKPGACDKFIRQSVPWVADFGGLSTGPLTVYVNRELTSEELSSLTNLLDTYVDPSVFLSFNHTETICLHSHFTTDPDNVMIDGLDVLQTVIVAGNTGEENVVLDSVKTVIEYLCPNLQNFISTTSGNMNLTIYDITRNVQIASETVELGSIATEWNSLAQTGSTDSNTTYRSFMFTGLVNKRPDHDCVWQFRGSTDNEGFTYRMNGLQYIFYDKY